MECESKVTVMVVRDGLCADFPLNLPTQVQPCLWCDTFFEAVGSMEAVCGPLLLVASVWGWAKVAASFWSMARNRNMRVVCWLQGATDLVRLKDLAEQGLLPDDTIQSGLQLLKIGQECCAREKSEICEQVSQTHSITLDDCDVSTSELQALLGKGMTNWE